MNTNFFIPELNNHDVQELWFLQDGATCHAARATIDLLKDMFGDRLISRFGPVNWPPRSCDLTPLDYFLWGYVKSLVYADKPQTLDHLEDNIRRVIADIRPQMLEKVIENWTSRLDYIRASRGSHMPEIILKIFFGHIDRLAAEDFMPNDTDILKTRVRTAGIVETNLYVQNLHFRFLDVSGPHSESLSWRECFKDASAIIFCAPLSEYDQWVDGDEGRSPDAGWDLKMWEIVIPDDLDQGNGTKLLNYCIAIGP
ncbi:guanine nucleotide-binding protein G(o) subunit alpha [Trichonephila clavipes]|uniref:Guanine nucleotide-binding protein G(O) subunit alpha n=1 Tax=Trichonephila clavipes TaxID=2585209 RepID=A0A8X6RLM7_TRICX|nr:guanine nucleotide-binding protein G(o) subunit alpha [Trichonephila clavipes]